MRTIELNPVQIGSGVRLASYFGVTDEAEATTTLSGGTVYAINIVQSGAGFLAAPTVSLTAAPSGGTNATATATIGNGFIVSVPVSGAGLGYTTEPDVTFSGGAGTGAAGKGILGPNGTIVGVRITNQGSGYTSAPTAAIAAAPSGGTNATLGTVVVVYEVTAHVITNAGAGYVTAPKVTYTSPGAVVIPIPFTKLLGARIDPLDPRSSGIGETFVLSSHQFDPDNKNVASNNGTAAAPGKLVFTRVKTSGTFGIGTRYQLQLTGA